MDHQVANAPAVDPGALTAVPVAPVVEGHARTRARDPYALSRWEQAWQEKLLPFLQIMIALVAVFFFVATLLQLNRIQAKIADAPTFAQDAAPEISGADMANLSAADRLVFVQWKTLAALERSALERRYHQANVLLMSRTWTRYLGFITGMIMALIGSAFILGKFREATTSLQVESAPVKGALLTASPGLALATLGTALMMATILIHNDIETRDVPMYVTGIVATTSERPELIRPGVPPSPDSVLGALLDPAARSSRPPQQTRSP